MLRKPLLALLATAFLAVSCGGTDIVVRSQEEEGPRFIVQVVDATASAGTGLSLTTDVDGNPHMTYVAFERSLAEGEPPPPPDPTAPVLPAVMHAHLVENLWTRSGVAEQRKVTPEDGTAIRLDADGVHHVAWTEGGQVLYANNAEGEFSKPEVVSQGPASGVSMAVSDDGTAFIAFYEQPRTAEGPTSLVRVATDGGGNWTVETAAEAEPPDGATTSIGTTSTGPMVAFGDSSGTVVARRADGDVWQSDVADPAGGTGVDMAVDPDGNPHVSYLTADGAVRHAHSIDGGPWEITDVADGPAVGRTAIALTEDGVHHVAWQDSELGVTYASNQEGDFAPETVGGTEGGTLPDLAAGADGIVYLAWHDSANAELQLATRTEDELLLAVPSPEAAPPGAAPEEAECQPEGTDLTLTAPQGAVTAGWAETCLAVEAGQPFTVQIVNQDAAPHNLGIYTSQGGENLFSSSPPTNPGATDTFDVPPIEETGNLYFQCDLHPTTMTGTFVVAAGGGAEGGGGGQAEQDTDGGGGGNQ